MKSISAWLVGLMVLTGMVGTVRAEMKIVTTTPTYADLAKQIGKD
jgi:ABC-type Zn uptake system ZnuABC Zn-binding protein ZnuA